MQYSVDRIAGTRDPFNGASLGGLVDRTLDAHASISYPERGLLNGCGSTSNAG